MFFTFSIGLKPLVDADHRQLLAVDPLPERLVA